MKANLNNCYYLFSSVNNSNENGEEALSRRGRRVQDKWRMKDWYDVYSPSYFGSKVLASIPVTSEENLIGRTVETTLYDITGDFSLQYLKLYFQIIKVDGKDVTTIFKGHQYTGDYLRSLVRRGSTRIDGIFNVTTKDGYKIRVSIAAFSVMRVRKSQISNVRKVAHQILNEKAENLNFDQFVQEIVLGKIGSDIYNIAKKIIPLRNVGARKSKLISYPIQDTAKESSEIEVQV
jgi:small subunit ribosomal protein S3Ae